MTNRVEKIRYAVGELAVKLGLSTETVYRGIQRGEIPHLRVGRRIILPKTAIDAWLANAEPRASRGGSGLETGGAR